MFTNIVQPNMNGVGGTPFASNIQVNNTNGQNGFDAESFIKILTAIVSGFNNTAMNLEGGLFANNNSQTITVDDVSEGLFIDNDELVVAGDGLSSILQQMISQMQLLGVSQPVIAINQDNQKTIEAPNNLTSQIHVNVNGNTALVNLIMKSEDGMQKVEAHTNTNSNANFDGNAFVQVKAMTNHELQVSMLENKIDNLPSSGAKSIDSKQAAQPDLRLTKGHENNYDRTILSLDSSLNAASSLYNTSYAKNDSAIVVKEPIHVSRLNELSEVMEKTVKAGDKHLIIKLEPPDMGSIQIKLRMDNGMLRADLKVDSPAVKDMFSMAIPQIKTSLEDSGIKVSDFFVDVKEDYYSDSGKRQQDDASHQNKHNKKQENFFDYFA